MLRAERKAEAGMLLQAVQGNALNAAPANMNVYHPSGSNVYWSAQNTPATYTSASSSFEGARQ